MIETLRIEGFGIVDQLELDFGTGLNVLTGETGAGKSLVLEALAFLAGGRASTEALRDGVSEATVEALFRTKGLPDLEALLAELGIEGVNHELVVRRTLFRNGRSRSRVGGQLVPQGTLSSLFSTRIEVSSQHATQSLLRPESQLRLVDAIGGHRDALEAVRVEAAALCEVLEESARLRAEAEERARREDFLAFQLREIDDAKPVAGEGEPLELERARLSHAERLHDEARNAAASLSGDPAAGDAPSVEDLLADAARRLGEIERIDPGMAEMAERVQASHAELSEVARELWRYAEGIEADPHRLSQVEERLALLERLRRKYGPDEQAILEHRDATAEELDRIRSADDRLEGLAEDVAGLGRDLDAAATRLTAARRKAGKLLSRRVGKALPALAMPEARFEVTLPPVDPPGDAPCGPGGRERAEFVFAANPGEASQALRKVASGGELSRLFLALKNALRGTRQGMVLVFDEVDAGIGGAVADRVGEALAELAVSHQVLCITHLPQLAAWAADHFQVSKAQESGRTIARVRRLDDAARIEEIARMAGGDTITPTTRRHARELLARRK